MKHFIVALALVSLIGTPLVAGAQAQIPGPGDTVLASGANGVIDLIRTITNWMFTILLVLAVVFILLAAFKYLTSGGGEEVAVAHKMLIYAAVAIAVAFLAKGIVFVVAELVTTGSHSSSSGNTWQFQYQGNNVGFQVGG